jgi:hypothetical protein
MNGLGDRIRQRDGVRRPTWRIWSYIQLAAEMRIERWREPPTWLARSRRPMARARPVPGKAAKSYRGGPRSLLN